MKYCSMRRWLAGLLALSVLLAASPVYALDTDESELAALETVTADAVELADPESPLEEAPEAPGEEAEPIGEADQLQETMPDLMESEPIPLKTDHSPYMNGYGDGRFGPGDTLTWAQICTMLYNVLADQSMGSATGSYSDVTEQDWYYTPVMTLISKGILPGDGGALGAKDMISRSDFVGLIVRLVGVDDTATCSFPDVPEDSPVYREVATAVKNGWIVGTDQGKFNPQGKLTRAEAATVFNRMLGRSVDPEILASATDLRAFDDVPRDKWFYGAVVEATTNHDATVDSQGQEHWSSYTHSYRITYQTGGGTSSELVYEGEKPLHIPNVTATHWLTPTGSIVHFAGKPVTEAATYIAWTAPALLEDHRQYIHGVGNGRFNPDGYVTRGEAAQIFYNLLRDKSKGSFSGSFTDVPSDKWYYTAVTTLASRGIIENGGAYRPEEPMTRGEMVALVTRLTGYTGGTSSFTDVAEDDPNYDAIVTATAKGWINGYGDGRFGPQDKLTRAAAVAIFNRVQGRLGDPTSADQMDGRYAFLDVPRNHWAFGAITEAATSHTYSVSGSNEKWNTYWHNTSGTVDWESSDSVVNAAKITNSITPYYGGDFTHNYNWDYSTGLKEWYVNSKHYSSGSDYLAWISLQNQKVYIFKGSKNNWKLEKTFICGSGKPSTPTPTGITYTTYREPVWYFAYYVCSPVVRFYPNTGYAFHSRLYKDARKTQFYDSSIGWPVSEGCIRMLDPDITYIYNTVPNRSTVIVY